MVMIQYINVKWFLETLKMETYCRSKSNTDSLYPYPVQEKIWFSKNLQITILGLVISKSIDLQILWGKKILSPESCWSAVFTQINFLLHHYVDNPPEVKILK